MERKDALPLELPARTASAATINPQAEARFHARDGLFFLSLGHLALLLGGLALFFTKHLWLKDDPLTVGGGIGMISGMTFCGLGFRKLRAARRVGLWTRLLAFGQIAEWIYGIGFATLLAGIALDDGSNYIRLLASIPTLAVAYIVLRRLCFSKQEPIEQAQAGLLFMLLGHVCLAGALIVANINVFQMGEWTRNFKQAWESGYFPFVLLQILLLGGWAGLNVIGLRRILAARRAGVKNRATYWGLKNAWLFLAMFASIGLLFYPFKSPVSYWPALSIAPSMLIALILGSGLARIRSKGQVSILRRTLICVPLVAFVLAYVPATLGMLISVIEFNPFTEKDGDAYWVQADWTWHLPEPIRIPIAKGIEWVAIKPARATRTNVPLPLVLDLKGYTSLADLRSRALQQPYGLRVQPYLWVAWMNRDPEGALETALAVPPVETMAAFSTPYDLGAGFLIGRCGSFEQIQERLKGAWSNLFIEGLVVGVPQARHKELFDSVRDCLASRTTNRTTFVFLALDFYGWRILSANPERARDLLMAYMADPSKENLSRLRVSIRCWHLLKDHDLLIESALASSAAEIRRMVMEFWIGTGRATPTSERWMQILAAAEGTLPNGDVAERRLAAKVLANRLLLDQGNTLNSTNVSPILNASEVAEIDAICKKVRLKLGKESASK